MTKNLPEKKLVQINSKTRIYVDVNITPDEMKTLKAKYNGIINNVSGHEFGKVRKPMIQLLEIFF